MIGTIDRAIEWLFGSLMTCCFFCFSCVVAGLSSNEDSAARGNPEEATIGFHWQIGVTSLAAEFWALRWSPSSLYFKHAQLLVETDA